MGTHKIYSGVQGIRDNISGSLYGDCHELLATETANRPSPSIRNLFYVCEMTGPDSCPTWLDHVTNKSSTLLRNFVRTRWKSILRQWSLTVGGGGRLVIFFRGGATIFWAPISGGLKFSEPAFRGGLQFSGSLWAMCGYYWVLCYWNFKYCLKYDGRASNINRIADSKLNRTVN